MWRKIFIILSTFVLAFGILFTSILRTAAVKYDFSQPSKLTQRTYPTILGNKSFNIDYYLVYPGRILPDSPLWPIKAMRDRIWLKITTNESRRAELNLLFADKRLAMSKILFEKGNPEVGFSILTKAEKYLEEAVNLEEETRKKGLDTSEFLQKLALASLKHGQIIDEILAIAPEDAKPGIIKTENYAKESYEKARNALLQKGILPPENPFSWN